MKVNGLIIWSIYVIATSIMISVLSVTTWNQYKELSQYSSSLSSARDSLAAMNKENNKLAHQRDSAIVSAQQMNKITDADAKEGIKFLKAVMPIVQKFEEDFQIEIEKLPKTEQRTTTVPSEKVTRLKNPLN